MTIAPPFDMAFVMPTDEQVRESAGRRYAMSGPFDIDRWPESIRALSMPTKMIEVDDPERWLSMWDDPANGVAAAYAAKLDEAMGWGHHFIRLNSRSPKDAAFPVAPITCAGKQAMWWITVSERCIDDSVMHWHAGAPIFICLREWRPIQPAYEFRCFAKGGEVIAVSRYDYLHDSKVPDAAAPRLMDAAKRFYGSHLAHHYGDVVFDIHALGSGSELLIELNPYGLSDPCCFGSYEEVEKGGVSLSRLHRTSGEGGE